MMAATGIPGTGGGCIEVEDGTSAKAEKDKEQQAGGMRRTIWSRPMMWILGALKVSESHLPARVPQMKRKW